MVRVKLFFNILALTGVALSFNAGASIEFEGRFSDGGFQGYSLEANGIAGSGYDYPMGIPGHLSLATDPEDPVRVVMAASQLSDDLPTHRGHRSEVSAPISPQGAERWYSWGMYIPASWDPPDGTAVAVMQIHDLPDAFDSARPPPLMVSIRDGEVNIFNTYDHDKMTKGSFVHRTLASWALQANKWTYFDIHAIWAGDDSGSLEIWKDGVSLFSEAGHINTYNDDRGVWFKAGIYDYDDYRGSSSSLTALFTGVRIGDGAESLRSMTMVPEPSNVALLALGIVLLMGVAQYKQSRGPQNQHA